MSPNSTSNTLNENLLSVSINPLGMAGGLEDLGKRILMNMTFPFVSGGDHDGGGGGDGRGGGSEVTSTACANNVTYRDCLFNVLKGLRELNDTSALTLYEVNTLHNRYVFFFCYFMAMCSVCYNPIVYFWMHKKFREEVNNLPSFEIDMKISEIYL